jgi:hypothetical protein
MLHMWMWWQLNQQCVAVWWQLNQQCVAMWWQLNQQCVAMWWQLNQQCVAMCCLQKTKCRAVEQQTPAAHVREFHSDTSTRKNLGSFEKARSMFVSPFTVQRSSQLKSQCSET